jgi:hypothetical protein
VLEALAHRAGLREAGSRATHAHPAQPRL